MSAANADRLPPAQKMTTGSSFAPSFDSACDLEVAAGDEHRAGDRALVVLVLLADVEELRLPELGLGLLG